MPAKEPELIWTTSDDAYNVIELYSTALDHVQTYINRRDIPAPASVIRTVVESPEIVVKSTKFDDTLLYQREGDLYGDYENLWIIVPVLFQGAFGTVQSLYSSSDWKKGPIVRMNRKL